MCIVQRVVANLVMARGVRRAEGDGVDEGFAGQHAWPHRCQAAHDVRLVEQELRHVIADLRHEATVMLEGFPGHAVDRYQPHAAVGSKHVGQAVVEQFAQQLDMGLCSVVALGQASFQFCDTRLQLCQ
ncbi:hypothetical protein D3C75_861480 [compost metagenome]